MVKPNPAPQAEGWDKKKTLKQNYENLGLGLKQSQQKNAIGNLNKDWDLAPELKDGKQEVTEEINVKELLANQLDRITKTTSKKKGLTELDEAAIEMATKVKKERKNCTIDEAWVLQRMVKKHGDDSHGMKKDLKLNKFMWTTNQIDKKLVQFHKKYPKGV